MKIVITGGPCNGKTTVINELRRRGFFVMEETPRKIIIEKKYSRYLDRYKDEALHLQQDIFNYQVEKEKDLDKVDEVYPNIMFLDRGYIDAQVFCKHLAGFIPLDMINPSIKRYDLVILLERLPFMDDDLRRETDEEAEKIHQDIIKAYTDAGYPLIFIPIMSIKNRVKAILKILSDMELTRMDRENIIEMDKIELNKSKDMKENIMEAK